MSAMGRSATFDSAAREQELPVASRCGVVMAGLSIAIAAPFSVGGALASRPRFVAAGRIQALG
jgi:hypothetical protein